MLLRLISKLSILVIAALTVLSTAASAIGSIQAPNPALAGFTEGCADKPDPCWYGIIPGVTTLDEGAAILANLQFVFSEKTLLNTEFSSANYRNENFPCVQIEFGILSEQPDVIADLSVDYCDRVTIGDFVNALGDPDNLNLSGLNYDHEQFNVSPTYRSAPGSNYCQSLMPEGHVQAFSLGFFYPVLRKEPDTAYTWHGMLPYGVYVQKYGFPSCNILDQI